MSLPKWILNPDDPDAIDWAVSDLERYFHAKIMEEINALAKKEGRPVKEIKDLTKPEKMRLLAQAMLRATTQAGKNSELIERAFKRIAYKAMRLQAHFEEEEDTFESFLVKRLGEVRTKGSLSEVRFMLELLATFEDAGNIEFVEALFKSGKNFAKFTKAIPFLREKHHAVLAVQERSKVFLGDLKKELSTLSYEKNRANEEELPRVEKRIEQKNKELEKEKKIHEDTIGRLQTELASSLATAVALTHNPRIDATGPQGISKLLYQGVRVNNEGKLEKVPEDLLPITLVGKLKIDKVYVNSHVAFVISAPLDLENEIERAVRKFSDIQTTDIVVVLNSLIREAHLEERYNLETKHENTIKIE